jgi:hypothetical protein
VIGRVVATAAFAAALGACGAQAAGSGQPSSHGGQHGGQQHGGAPITCLSPHTPSPTPKGGWFSQNGPNIYSPEGRGVSTAPSGFERQLAARFAHDIGKQGYSEQVSQYSHGHCPIVWDVYLQYHDSSDAFAQFLQLTHAVQLGSFPMVNSNVVTSNDHGVTTYQVVVNPKHQTVDEVAVRSDGLLAYFEIRSPSGYGTSGWPTTTVPPPGPARPGPVTGKAATGIALDLLSKIAAQ